VSPHSVQAGEAPGLVVNVNRPMSHNINVSTAIIILQQTTQHRLKTQRWTRLVAHSTSRHEHSDCGDICYTSVVRILSICAIDRQIAHNLQRRASGCRQQAMLLTQNMRLICASIQRSPRVSDLVLALGWSAVIYQPLMIPSCQCWASYFKK